MIRDSTNTDKRNRLKEHGNGETVHGKTRSIDGAPKELNNACVCRWISISSPFYGALCRGIVYTRCYSV